MDLVRIGKFIAQLRKERSLSQEQLGEMIGVTNKTVSRWETGMYLPSAEMLLSMSTLFGVSINELLSGRRLGAEEYKEAAESNLKMAVQSSTFTLREKMNYYKEKWLREHIAAMCFWGVGIVAAFLIGIVLKQYLLIPAAVLLLVVGHGWRNNTMMTYVERKVFDDQKATIE